MEGLVLLEAGSSAAFLATELLILHTGQLPLVPCERKLARVICGALFA
jgi:hypothetical protein